MNDLTLLYYSANRLPEHFANNVMTHLLRLTKKRIPLITVTQKPIKYGFNICVGDIGASAYNVYKQILIGAKEAKTDFIACCEDDSLYTMEHLSFRPPMDVFAYNVNRLNVDHRGVFFYRYRRGMCACIAPREYMIETLEKRFKMYPEHILIPGFGEPGRYEYRLRLEPVGIMDFKTVDRPLTFSHRYGMGRRRRIMEKDFVIDRDPYWGTARSLWDRIHG